MKVFKAAHPKKKDLDFRNLTMSNFLPSPTITGKPSIPHLMRNYLYFPHWYNATWRYGSIIDRSQCAIRCAYHQFALKSYFSSIPSLLKKWTTLWTKFKETPPPFVLILRNRSTDRPEYSKNGTNAQKRMKFERSWPELGPQRRYENERLPDFKALAQWYRSEPWDCRAAWWNCTPTRPGWKTLNTP